MEKSSTEATVGATSIIRFYAVTEERERERERDQPASRPRQLPMNHGTDRRQYQSAVPVGRRDIAGPDNCHA